MVPAQRRRQTLDGVKRLLLREAREQPVAVILEDLHWIDGETQALLEDLVEGLSSVRLLLLVNYRPECQHSWASKTYYSQHRLDASLLLAQNAPLTYVSAQLGHTDATTTLRWYARWIPRPEKRAVDGLDEVRANQKLRLEAAQGGMVGDQLVTNPGPESQIEHSGDSEVPDSSGGPSRTRTLDPLIKSQLLYQLS